MRKLDKNLSQSAPLQHRLEGRVTSHKNKASAAQLWPKAPRPMSTLVKAFRLRAASSSIKAFMLQLCVPFSCGSLTRQLHLATRHASFICQFFALFSCDSLARQLSWHLQASFSYESLIRAMFTRQLVLAIFRWQFYAPGSCGSFTFWLDVTASTRQRL